MKTRNHPVHDCHGGILLTAVVIGGVLLIALAAALSLSSSHNETTVRSGVWNKALVVAEAGVEEALAQLNQTSRTWSGNGWTLNGDQYSKQRWIGSDYYVVRIRFANSLSAVIHSTASVSLPARSNRLARAVLVNAKISSGLRGMVAKGKLVVSDSVRTDSYDSSNPAYSTGGLYDPAKARDNGDIGTISIDPMSADISGGAQINGRIGTGTRAGLKIANPATVGSFAWTADNANAGKVQPGWHNADWVGAFTNINFPTAAGTIMPGSGTVGGAYYDYVLGTDKYWLGSLSLNGKIALVTGNATLIIDDTLDVSGSGGFRIAPGARLTVYVRKSATIGGNGILNGTGNPTNFTYYGGPDNSLVAYRGTADFIGTIYAPNATMDLKGASQFFGSSVSNEILLGGNFKYHYDEAGTGGNMLYVVSSWDEL
jgi:hypothetical protein